LTAQSGLFTTIGFYGIHFMQNNGARTAVEEFVAQSGTNETVLRKVSLSHACVADLRQILEREQMSRAALMPTRDNIAIDVLRRWQTKGS
ncbi:hypothetical protein WDZ92_51215, partial [Nostoc sp. NIES-2111]